MLIFNKFLSLLAISVVVFFEYAVFIRQYYDTERIYLIYKKRVKSWIGTSSFFAFLIVIGCTILWIVVFGWLWGLLYFNVYLIIVSFSFKTEKFILTRRSGCQLGILLLLFLLLGVGYVVSDLSYYISFPIFFSCPLLLISSSFFMEYPIELIIRHHYLTTARKKLKFNDKLIIIGITGSFGKTSFKKALFTLLNEKYRVIKSPGSVNTLMGLTKFINHELTPYDEIIILECGVDKPKGMDKLLKLFRPDIAVITAIGEMHLATFKSLENIKKEKLKLAKGLKNQGVTFFQKNEYLSADDFAGLAVGYALKGEYQVSPKGSEISLEYQNKKIEITVNLFGKYQLENVFGAIKIAEYLHISAKELVRGLAKITPEPQRLSLQEVNQRFILDDAYNSNEKGLIEAINVLKKFPRATAIITPGVIELGDAYERVNQHIGENLVGIDRIYIISSISDHPLIKGYSCVNGDLSKLAVFPCFAEAYQDFLREDIKTLLIANDTSKVFIK